MKSRIGDLLCAAGMVQTTAQWAAFRSHMKLAAWCGTCPILGIKSGTSRPISTRSWMGYWTKQPMIIAPASDPLGRWGAGRGGKGGGERGTKTQLVAKIRRNLAEVKALLSASDRFDASLIGQIRMDIWAMENELRKIEDDAQ